MQRKKCRRTRPWFVCVFSSRVMYGFPKKTNCNSKVPWKIGELFHRSLWLSEIKVRILYRNTISQKMRWKGLSLMWGRDIMHFHQTSPNISPAIQVLTFSQSNSTVPGTAGRSRFWCFFRFRFSWSWHSASGRPGRPCPFCALAFLSFHFTLWSRLASTQSNGPLLAMWHFRFSKKIAGLKGGGKYMYQQDWKGDVCPSSPTQDGLHDSGTKSRGIV